MRETRWPPARGRAGILIDRPALAGAGARRARPDADLGRSRRGGRRARAGRADRSASTRSRRRARTRCGSARRARFWSRRRRSPPPKAGATAGARSSVDDGWTAVEVVGRRRAAGAHASDLGRPRRRLALGRHLRFWPARPAGADASGFSAACRGAVARDAAGLARRRLKRIAVWRNRTASSSSHGGVRVKGCDY